MLKVACWERETTNLKLTDLSEEKKKVGSGEDYRSSALAVFFLLPFLHLENLSDLCLFFLPPNHCVWWCGSSGRPEAGHLSLRRLERAEDLEKLPVDFS